MIRLQGVHKSFRRGDLAVVAVDIESLDVTAGEHLALLGQSGSGKSTLLNLIAGLLLPESGTVEVDGVAINRLSEGQRDRFRGERMGYVFQTFNLLQNFTAVENVQMAQLFAGRHDVARARELLDQVGLGHRMHHYPRELSVGQQQRVALARALVNRPRVLLADEPTGNLDRTTGTAVLELLRTLARADGCTVVMVTHDPGCAGQLDRQLVLEPAHPVGAAPSGVGS
jgi:putative ABC transport system ATP-binding protein